MQIAAVRCGHCTRYVTPSFSICGPRSMSLLQLSTATPFPPPPPTLTEEQQEARLLAVVKARQRPPRDRLILNPPVPNLVSRNPRATIQAVYPRKMPLPPFPKSPGRPPSVSQDIRRPSTANFYPSTSMSSNIWNTDSAYSQRPPQGWHDYSPRDEAMRRQIAFSRQTNKILRHTARSMGYQIVPDGFVRVSDVMRDVFYREMDFKTFAKFCDDDPDDAFEIAMLPDLISGQLVDIPWVRARHGHSIPSVDRTTHRILNMGKLQIVTYVCKVEEWERLPQHGISEGPGHCIRMYRNLAGNLYKDFSIPARTKLVCVTIDADQAARLGVMFFSTVNHKLLVVGNRDRVVPPETFRNAILLDVVRTDLQKARPPLSAIWKG